MQHAWFIYMWCICMTLAEKPNIVFILTDDHDVFLGGQIPIPKTNKLIGDGGVIFESMYVASPLCCPSRSSILTGKYVHSHRAFNNSLAGGCSSREWQKTQEPGAFPVYLKKQKYTTFFAGKYLNQYGLPGAGGVKHVPPGWDWWNGLVGNSVYYNYQLSVNGSSEKHGNDPDTDYLTDLINRRATDFLNQRSTNDGPFFMMLSTPSAHAPFTPAPKYKDSFSDKQAPRTKSFNTHGKDKHWLIRNALNPMPNDTIDFIDETFRNRWRTLLSVDDMVENVINILTQKNMINNTYVFFTSDNGFHLGQFSLPWDKRQLYEFDNKVPFMVRGPGIKAGSLYLFPVSSIDLAPTFLEMAGSPIPKSMEGESLLQLLTTQTGERSSPLRLEHYGESHEIIDGCPQYTNQSMGYCDKHCVCEDSRNNTFMCYLTWLPLYKICYVVESKIFLEAYNLEKDPDEMNNLAYHLNHPGYEGIRDYVVKEIQYCKHTSCNYLPKLIEDSRGKHSNFKVYLNSG